MTAALSLHRISKRFGAVHALQDVDLDVFPGEVQAVLGENGAGKSTLMHVIYGLVAPDAGRILRRGAAVRFASALDARRAGIGMVHQEFALVDALSIAENLVLSVCPAARWRWRAAEVGEAAQQRAAQLGIELGDLDTPVGALPVGQRQRLEILKALAGAPEILILDEPTAVLTPSEVDALFAVIERLRAAGTAVLFITHKLPEVLRIADRITVMRRGRIVARARRGELPGDELARLMVGPLPEEAVAAAPTTDAPDVLELRELSVLDEHGRVALDHIGLTVRGGEVLGIAGVDGNGQSELFEVLSGTRAPSGGSVRVAGAPLRQASPSAAIDSGIVCVPPDRQRQGVVPAMSVRENAVLNSALLRRLSAGPFTDPSAEIAAATAMVERYAIKIGGLDEPVRGLSGGNMQKLIVARALSLEPRVLVAVNPTRGLDLAAAQAVHASIAEALARGAAVLLISTDLDEVLSRSHRVAVLYGGRLSQVLSPPFSSARIGELMAGDLP